MQTAKLKWVINITAALGCGLLPAWAQQLDTGPLPAPSRQPLMATVSKTLFLPPAMYGQWSVTGTLVETDTPDMFAPIVYDIWVLDRQDDAVFVSNPVTGASASISVDAVQEDTATFHRIAEDDRLKIVETPTVTVKGDTFSGHTEIKKQYFRRNGSVKTQTARYTLQAYRINDARVKFKAEEMQDPDLEIEDIQFD